MTNSDFRALCAELVDKIEGMVPFGPDEDHLTNRARAALAQPEPVTHQDKLDRLIAMDRNDPANNISNHH
jgi:hypothetical protein